MKKFVFNKKSKIIIATLLVLGIVGGGYMALRPKAAPEIVEPPSKKPKKQVNLIPQSERPYVTLQPLQGRNMLELTIHDLKKPAKSVEVTLEYDRNKGVLDAVLNSFAIDETPLIEEMFLGSKSAGGHTTYHDDVIGGTMTLDFSQEDYALEVPWRYDDAKTSYDQLSTSDGKFQLSLDKPIKQSKVVIMQSPGLPGKANGEVLSGPYYISTVGDLPETTMSVSMRITEESPNAVIMGWDGTEWVEYPSTVDGKTVSTKGDLVSTYIVVSN